jgi:GNAT superfamily N-acetyltransferase
MTKTSLLPTTAHIPDIQALNSKYLISHLSDGEKQGGFVRVEYTADGLQQIINNKEMVAAMEQDKIIGYYLIGRKSSSAALDYQKNKALSLFDTHNIPFDKIGYGAQVCIDEAHRNNGLFSQMLAALIQAVQNKYTHLLCSVSDDNIVSLNAHINAGWKLIDQLETTQFFIYETNKLILD